MARPRRTTASAASTSFNASGNGPESESSGGIDLENGRDGWERGITVDRSAAFGWRHGGEDGQ